MRRVALALTLSLLSSAALAQQVNDIQLRQGSSSLWGATFNANNNQVIDQFNTAGSVVDSFRWFQGTSAAQGTFLWSVSPTGHVAGAATGGRQGAGTINAKGFYVDGVAVGGGGGTPGGSSGQVQYNNAGAFGGFTTSGDATINTASGALTLATVNANVGTFGSATSCITTTANAKGLITAISAATCTPALGSITGFGTGVATALAINIGSAGAPVLFNGALGTPSSGNLVNATGYQVAQLAGMGAGCATWLGIPSSANLRGCLTDESGTGVLYFQGGDAGTPSALVGTNISGTAASLTVGNATKLATARAIGIAGSTGLTATGVNFDGTAAINPALTGTLVVANGGTNATTAAGARTSLGVSAAPTGFSVHKNATDQTGIVDSAFTPVTWSTELFDTGSNFASNTWTPPAGLITTSATLTTSGTNQVNGAFFIVSFFKNAVRFKDQYMEIIATGTPLSATVTMVDQANGTDAYDVRVFIDTTGATGTVTGIITQTYWTGMAFGP